jgi:SAM-dependent methyltransferase
MAGIPRKHGMGTPSYRDSRSGRSRAIRSRSAVEAGWDLEYSVHKTLPSTLASGPSRCIPKIIDLLHLRDGFKVLDLGCGNGRHSVFFAQRGCNVRALDISGYALTVAKRKVEAQGLWDRVEFHHGCALEGLPQVPEGFDLILDSYMSCHILDGAERKALFKVVQRALSPTGLFVSFGISLQDSFYRAHAKRLAGLHATVCDPITSIEKLLVTEEYFRAELQPLFNLHRVACLPMSDTIRQREYDKEAIYLVATSNER